MDRQDVQSTVIGAVGYSRVLEIEFESGRIYQYYGVPENVFNEFMGAASKGKYYNAHVKGKYQAREITVKPRRL